MGYPKHIYDKAWDSLLERKRSAEELSISRRKKIHAEIPEIADIEREMARQASRITREIIASPEDAPAKIQKIAANNLAMQDKRKQLLLNHGYPADYLAEQFGCHKCRDKGYIGINMCECFKELLKSEAYKQLTMSSKAKNCGFEDFSLTYYSDVPTEANNVSPRDRMKEILLFCRSYADNFSDASESLLFLGHTGLGKTHLSLAVASKATELGFGVVYTPVQNLLDRLESERFSNDYQSRESYLENTRYVLDCDLLILDDLGTEFSTQFSNSVLYNIVNTRLVSAKPTIISTNLDLSQIEQRYSQRMVSRLVGEYKVLKFVGKDVRYIKKIQKS